MYFFELGGGLNESILSTGLNPFTPKVKEGTFFRPFEEKYISEVVRIGSTIIYYLSEPSSSYYVM